MTRFVAVWSLQRGILEAPEPLGDGDQWEAFNAMRMNASRNERVAFELGEDLSAELPGELGETVIWNQKQARSSKPMRCRKGIA